MRQLPDIAGVVFLGMVLLGIITSHPSDAIPAPITSRELLLTVTLGDDPAREFSVSGRRFEAGREAALNLRTWMAVPDAPVDAISGRAAVAVLRPDWTLLDAPGSLTPLIPEHVAPTCGVAELLCSTPDNLLAMVHVLYVKHAGEVSIAELEPIGELHAPFGRWSTDVTTNGRVIQLTCRGFFSLDVMDELLNEYALDGWAL